jgi:hypothetical protein
MFVITPNQVLSLREARSDIRITGWRECSFVLQSAAYNVVTQCDRLPGSSVRDDEYPSLRRSVERLKVYPRRVRDSYLRNF